MSDVGRRYVFAPLEQRGVLAGLRAGQLVLIGGALVVGTALVRAMPDGSGIVAAVLVLLSALAFGFAPISGRPAEQWMPVAVTHGARRLTGLTTVRPKRPAPDGTPPISPPRAFASLRFGELADVGGCAVGRVVDRSNGCATAVVAVRGGSFSLLDRTDQERRLDAWSSVLAGLSREGGTVRSVSWVHRTVPGDAEALERHLHTAARADRDSPEFASYAELVAEAGPVGHHHECLVALTVGAPRRRPATVDAVLLRELRLLEGQLRAADLDVEQVLTVRQLGAVLRTAFDPWARTAVARRAALHPDLPGPLPAAAWPAATDGGWSWWRTDEAWHATFWIAEWPRREVGPDFLGPLLLQTGAQRRVAVVMSPLAPSAGFREAEAARTAQAADEQLRQRAGFLPTARRHREAEGVARRESELSDGHAAYRFSGFVTVTAASPEGLELAAGEVVQAGHRSRLELRRLHGIQADAFCWTLPFGRGLATR